MTSKGGGGGGGGGALPLPPSTECCMCGDHGITKELFRCRSCQFRCQHKYCSDLYPKPEPYKSCNWCLREETKKKVSSSPPTENNSSNNSSISSSTTNENKNDDNSGQKTKLQRSPFPSKLDKPIKKQKQRPKLERSASEVIVRPKYGLRGKIRRYKLLEEVSS